MGDSGGRSADGDRWEALFADLGAELSAADAADLAAEVADRARSERGRQRLADRLRAAHGRPLRLHVRAVGAVAGVARDSGPDWIRLAEEFGRDALVPLSAVLFVGGLGAEARPAAGRSLDARLDLRHALRRLMRDRAEVVVSVLDGTALTGTLDRVGADFVDLTRHAAGVPRRPTAVREVATVPLPALACVRSQSPPAEY